MKDSLHQAWLADCLGEATGRESQVGRAGLEGTHSKTVCKTTQQHYSATQGIYNKKGKNNRKIKSKTKTKSKSKRRYLNINKWKN